MAVVSGGRSCATHDQARYVYRPQVQLFGRDLRRSNLVGRLYDPEQLGGCAPNLDDLPADRLSLGPRGAVFLTHCNNKPLTEDLGTMGAGVESVSQNGHRLVSARPRTAPTRRGR